MSNIREVANLARVSPATVSRVLNNDTTYKIKAQTRERVWKAVAELNYKAPVSTQRHQKRGAVADPMRHVGCLLALTKGKYNDPYYLSILSGAESYLLQHHCELSFVKTEMELDEPKTLESVLQNPVDGLIMMRPLKEPVFTLLRERIPCLVGIDTGHMPIDNIEYDHYRVARMAVTHLYHKGYREIGFIGGGAENEPMTRSRRYRSYRETMRELDLPVRDDWVLDCGWDDERLMVQVVRLAKRDMLPRAFFAASDLMAMAALRSLYNMGVPVPARVAVMGLTNIEMSKYSNPPLTTIHIPSEEMGMIAASTLIARMDGDDTLPKRIILPSSLVERSSV